MLSQQGNLLNSGFELGKIEYSIFPSLSDIQLERQGLTINLGKKLHSSVLGFGLNYNKYDLTLKDTYENNLFNSFRDFHSINFRLFYSKPIKNNWTMHVAFSPTLSSNFERNLSMEDLIFASFASFEKTWINDDFKSNLRLGIGYGTLFGAPTILPLISYSKQINNHLGYSIGLPVTGIFYQINKQNSLNLTLKPEGFFVNNSGKIAIEGTNYSANTKLQFNALNMSLGYRLKLGDNWISHFNIGYLPINNMEVLNENNNTIYDFDSNESIAINVGLSFNIKRNNNENNQQKN